MAEKKKKSTSKKTQTKKTTPVKKSVKVSSKKVAAPKKISKQGPKKIKKTPVKEIKNIKTEEVNKPEKNDKWYVWLKNNIVENETKFSKEYKYRRLLVCLFAVLCFLVVVISTLIIDFSNSIKNKEVPYFTIKQRDEYKQMTVYYGLFYKAWRCDNGNTSLVFGRLSDSVGYCSIIPEYDENGIFTNPNKVKMSKSEVNIIKTYYFDNYIYFEKEKDVKNAYTLAKALDKVIWVNGDQKEIINNDESIELAVFGKVDVVNGVEAFELQFDDTYYHKCVKKFNDEYLVSDYNYSTNTCGTSWEKLTLDKEVCEIAENSTEFIKNLAPIVDYCK